MTRARALGSVALAALVALAVLTPAAGCSRGPSARYVADGGAHTLADVERSAAGVSLGDAAAVKVEDAPRVRQQVLARLRSNGASAGQAADLMTREFPVETKAVPLHVEAATVDGKAVWIVVEAWADRTGDLKYRRLWVFDRTTSYVLDSKTYR